MCRPPHLPQDIFDEIKELPDSVPRGYGHNKLFDIPYGSTTNKDHRPSLKRCPYLNKSLPFVASVQHARNTNLMVQCVECEMWRLIIPNTN